MQEESTAHRLVPVVGARWHTCTQVSVCGGCKMVHLHTGLCLWWMQDGATAHRLVKVVGAIWCTCTQVSGCGGCNKIQLHTG